MATTQKLPEVKTPSIRLEIRVSLGSGPSRVWWAQTRLIPDMTDKDAKRAWARLFAERLSGQADGDEATRDELLRDVADRAIREVRRYARKPK